jgi:excisionase family DNA binding protein
MEGLVTVKASDLLEIFKKLDQLQTDLKEIRDKDDYTTALSIEQVAERLNVHYCSVRTLVIKGELFAKHLHGTYGKYMIPLWALKEYLSRKDNKTNK